jgi:serine protease Do
MSRPGFGTVSWKSGGLPSGGVRAAAAMAILSFCLVPALADRVELVGGRAVEGEILKSDEQVVIVDLGPQVLRLRREDVLRVETADAAATAPAEEQPADRWQLFREARLAPASIESCVERFGESVVMVSTPSGLGSGFVIDPSGHVVTNYHVIAGERHLRVTVFRRSEEGFEQKIYRKVRIVAMNPFADLALLKIEGEDGPFQYAYLGQIDRIEAGQRCFAIGNPLGLTRTVSQGIVSTKNRDFAGQLYIQTTTDINPGNSGGPLFNASGEVIGVTSMGYLFFGGLNFAIPVDVVKRFILNRDAFAYDEDNPNNGFRYLQPPPREDPGPPPPARLPRTKAAKADTPDENPGG